jgi:hypothetical protein
MKTGRPRTEKRAKNGALWTLFVALSVSLLVSAPGCGQESAQEDGRGMLEGLACPKPSNTSRDHMRASWSFTLSLPI